MTDLSQPEAMAFAKSYPKHRDHTQGALEPMVEASFAHASRVPCSCGKRLALTWASLMLAQLQLDREMRAGEDVLI